MRKVSVVTQAKSFLIVGVTYVFLWCGTSVAQDLVTGQVCECLRPSVTATVTDEAAERLQRFRKLAVQWKIERGATSSITEAALRGSYQEIIGLGPDAIPLILAQMRAEGADPDQWFWALQAISGTNPVQEADQGDYLRMSQAWQLWAEQKGYAW